MNKKDIIFKVNDHYIGFEIKSILEVVLYSEKNLISVPDINKFFMGIIGTDYGEIPVTSLSNIIDLTEPVITSETCILVISSPSGVKVGILLDLALCVMDISEEDSSIKISDVNNVFPFVSGVYKVGYKSDKIYVKQVSIPLLFRSLELNYG